MATAGDNEQRLREAGMIIAEELPPEYADIVERLTEEELEVILGMKEQLDQAEQASGIPVAQVMIAP